MATQFAFAVAAHDMDRSPYPAGATFEVMTASGASAATTAVAGAHHNICRVATTAAVYVTFAAAPVASATTGFLCPANSVHFFRVKSGDKGAAITA